MLDSILHVAYKSAFPLLRSPVSLTEQSNETSFYGKFLQLAASQNNFIIMLNEVKLQGNVV